MHNRPSGSWNRQKTTHRKATSLQVTSNIIIIETNLRLRQNIRGSPSMQVALICGNAKGREIEKVRERNRRLNPHRSILQQQLQGAVSIVVVLGQLGRPPHLLCIGDPHPSGLRSAERTINITPHACCFMSQHVYSSRKQHSTLPNAN